MLLFWSCLEILHLLLNDFDICTTHIMKYIPVFEAEAEWFMQMIEERGLSASKAFYNGYITI